MRLLLALGLQLHTTTASAGSGTATEKGQENRRRLGNGLTRIPTDPAAVVVATADVRGDCKSFTAVGGNARGVEGARRYGAAGDLDHDDVADAEPSVAAVGELDQAVVVAVASMQLVEAEAAFRIQKSDPKIRPVWHQKEERVQAHILVCFLAYVLWKTLSGWQQKAGLGSSPRTILEEFKRINSVDVVLPVDGGPELRLRCVVRPDKAQAALLNRLGLTLPKRLRPNLPAKL